MKDLMELPELLYNEDERNHPENHPLHRDDELYRLSDPHQQAACRQKTSVPSSSKLPRPNSNYAEAEENEDSDVPTITKRARR
jgi:hypothetical protein